MIVSAESCPPLSRCRFNRLLIIGTREDIAAGHHHSRIAPKAVSATLGAFEVRFDRPVIHVETPKGAARLIERWAWWYSRDVVQNANDLLRGSRIVATS